MSVRHRSRLSGRWSAVKRTCALLVLLVSCGGGGGEEPTPVAASGPTCDSEEIREARQALMEAAGLPARRPPPPEVELLEKQAGPNRGYSITAVRWTHGEVPGDRVHGLLTLPDPPPDRPLPLLVNVHGHWEAGVEAGEVLFRSELFALRGWAVLSVSTRGAELGDEPVPPWRAAHFSDGLYGEMRGRRTGRTPLGWNVVAAWGGIDAALAGRLGPSIDREQVAISGFSGGVEQAVAVATTDPRIGGVVIGSFEYAFGSQDGAAGCSCGTVPGGHDPERRARWLSLAACRPGAPPRPRATLAWDGQPQTGLASGLSSLGATVRGTDGEHGINRPMSAASWSFLEAHLRGGAVPAGEEDAAREAAAQAWDHFSPSLRSKLHPDSAPPGVHEQGADPTRAGIEVAPERARTLLRLNDGAWDEQVALAERRLDVTPAIGSADGRGWVVVVADTPDRATAEPFDYIEPGLDGQPVETLSSMDRSASVAVVRPRTSGGQVRDERLARWAAERGLAPLGIAVEDALAAAEALAARPEVDRAKIGWVGVGAGAPVAAWAAALGGGASPVVLVDAPVTLWAPGPTSSDEQVDLRPWPLWLFAPIRQGVALDPWMAAANLGDRARWVSPRGGDGQPTDGPLPAGRSHPDVASALR